MTNPPTSVRIPAPPLVDEPWAAPHHGRFKISDSGDRRGYVSFGGRFAADRICYVTIVAKWSYLGVGEVFADNVAPETVAYGPSLIGDPGGEFSYVSSVFFDLPAPVAASHWEVEVRLHETHPGTAPEPSGLVPGTRVRMDNIYVPDNGYPIADQPYLDGDQPYGVWEGPRAASTSVFGDKPLSDLSLRLTIEEELMVSDPQDELLHSLYLDDDLNL